MRKAFGIVKRIALVAAAAFAIAVAAAAFFLYEIGVARVEDGRIQATPGGFDLADKVFHDPQPSTIWLWRGVMHAFYWHWHLKQAATTGPANAWRHWREAQGIDREPWLLELTPRALRELDYFAKLSLQRGLILSEYKQWVTGTLTINGHVQQARMRLQGAHIDHVLTRQRSLNVRLGDGHVDGADRFNLHHPWVRRGPSEWLTQRLATYAGLATIPYRPVRVDALGLGPRTWDLEVRWSPQLAELNRLRDGPIVKIVTYADPKSPNGVRVAVGNFDDDAPTPFSPTFLLRLQELIQAWHAGDMPTHALFDVRDVAYLLAVVDLVHSRHGLIPDNLVWHWDPVRAKLRPMGREYHAEGTSATLAGDYVESNDPVMHAWARALLRDQSVRKAYRGALEHVSSQAFLAGFEAANREGLRRAMRLWHLDHPFYANPWPRIEENAAYVRARLENFKIPVTKSRVSRIPTTAPPPVWFGESGTDALRPTPAAHGGLRIGPGRFRVAEPVVFARGTTVEIAAGTVIELAVGGRLVVRGPLQVRGRVGAPVAIRGEPGNGGVFVDGLDASSSNFHYLEAEGLAALAQGIWAPSGAITVLGDVDVRHASIFGSDAEDALNVLYGHASVADSRFRDCRSDCIDVDFGSLSVTRSAFVAAGNDAIDVEASALWITDVTVQGAGDKAVSVGERSRAVIERLDAGGVGIGIAVKDGSEASLRAVAIGEAVTAVAVYRGKRRYDGGRAVVDGLRASAATTTSVDAASTLVWGGR